MPDVRDAGRQCESFASVLFDVLVLVLFVWILYFYTCNSFWILFQFFNVYIFLLLKHLFLMLVQKHSIQCLI